MFVTAEEHVKETVIILIWKTSKYHAKQEVTEQMLKLKKIKEYSILICRVL